MDSVDYRDTDSDLLIQRIFEQRAMQAALQDSIQRMEHVLVTRMEEENASAIPHPHFEVMRVADGWEDSKLRTLYELMPAQEVAKAILPEKKQVIITPERWDGRVLRTFTKFGSEVRDTIEGARRWKRQVRITERKS